VNLPTRISTARLTLHPPVETNWPGYRGFLMGPRARFFGAPKNEACAREIFEAQRDHWNKGFGPFVVHLRAPVRPVGVVGVGQPEGIPEPELAWSIWEDADEGKGFAFEAAIAAREAYFTVRPTDRLVSYIDPENTRSVALAQRLGCAADQTTPAPFEGGVTWRHASPDNDGSPEAYA